MSKINYKKIPKKLEEISKPGFGYGRAGVGLEGLVKEFYFLDTKDLLPFGDQARKNFNQEEMDNLRDSIKKYGVRQPLTVIPDIKQKGKFEVVSGERRLRAAKLAGLAQVPCIILEDVSIAQEVAIVENIHRQDLHPIEFGLAFKALIDNGFFASQVDLAKKLAIRKTTVSEFIGYTEIPKKYLTHIIENNIRTRAKLRRLVKSKNNEGIIEGVLGIRKGAEKGDFSVMRVDLTNGTLNLQTPGIKKLDENQRKILKKKLHILLENLS